MMKTCKRVLAVLCTLACLLSCMSLAVSAEGDVFSAKIGFDEAATDTGATSYSAGSNTLTMRAGKKLRLICQGELPENATVTWTSDDEETVTIDDHGVVTTGKKCVFSLQKLYLPLWTILPYDGILPMETPYILIPGFKGKATIKMTVSDAAGNVVDRELNLEIKHTLFDFIRYKIGL